MIKIELTELLTLLKYQFKNQELLIEALSHPSLKQNKKKDSLNYERLELLGDSILNFIITEMLYLNYKSHDEGKLARIRSYFVCKNTICKVAAKLNLAKYIIMTEGEENSGGRTNPNNIENTMEAIIAAIYLDSNIDEVRKIIINLWGNILNDPNLNDSDSKTALQEWSQSNYDIKPIYEIVGKVGPSHMPSFEIKVTVGKYFAIACGNSIKIAEKEAAKNLLDKIGIKEYYHK